MMMRRRLESFITLLGIAYKRLVYYSFTTVYSVTAANLSSLSNERAGEWLPSREECLVSSASTDQLILAVDQGTTNSKAALISADGQMVAGRGPSVGSSSPRLRCAALY